MKNIETSIVIDASVKEVWDAFIDFSNYPMWNPFIRSLIGKPEVGEQLVAELSLPGKKPMIFKPMVLTIIPNQEFRWLGKLFVKGLFDGEHYFKLEKLADNQTRFIQGENFRGLLSGILFKMIGEETRKGFEEMNIALENRLN